MLLDVDFLVVFSLFMHCIYWHSGVVPFLNVLFWELLPPYRNVCQSLSFFTTLTIRLIQKLMQVSFTLLVTCFIIVGILSLTCPFTHLR
jgi:hypothetical protein